MVRERPARESSDTLLTRRSYAKLVAAAVTSIVISGAAGVGSARRRFDTVNVVEAGADPTGDVPVDDVLRRHAADDTLLLFPDGEYLLTEFDARDLANFGMRGIGDATLVAPPGTRGDWMRITGGRDVLLRDISLDASAPDGDVRVLFRPDDGLDVRNVRLTGWHAPADDGSVVLDARTAGTTTVDGLEAVGL